MTFDKKSPTPHTMTKAIEIKLPGKNPTTIFLQAIRSIVFQKSKEGTAYDDAVIIGIQGWDKPFIYESKDALKVYEKLVSMFDVVQLDV